MVDRILTAGAVITMDDAMPRADAVAVSGDTIVAVGTLEQCQAALAGAEVVATGAAVLAPGFIDPHSHPLASGSATQAPAHSIAPWDAQSWDDALTIFRTALAESAPGTPLVFAGFDALLLEHPAPTAPELDEIFGDRIVGILDNSGHAVYFTSATIRDHGWDATPPADPVGGRFGRNPDGSLNGQAFEIPAGFQVLIPIMQAQGGNPLVQAADYYAWMARNGITSTSDMTYEDDYRPAYEALASLPSTPLRISMWQMSTTENFAAPVEFAAGEKLLVKRGVKLWTDGSPWVGNIGISFPYLHTHATDIGGIDGSKAGVVALNYTRAEVDALLDTAAPLGWSMSFHANGDMAIDFALDAYERALSLHGLMGTDHRWRLEHVGAGRADQFERAARLGVHISMGPFQYYYWGDLLDGQMFDSEYGSRWQNFRGAFDSGAVVSFHNDGAVSPPTPILNMQTAISRKTQRGNVHRPELVATVHEAMQAQTINAAKTMHRDDLVGSIAVGKLADFVELSADPYAVDPHELNDQVAVLGTWLGGERIDLDAFLGAAAAIPAPQPPA